MLKWTVLHRARPQCPAHRSRVRKWEARSSVGVGMSDKNPQASRTQKPLRTLEFLSQKTVSTMLIKYLCFASAIIAMFTCLQVKDNRDSHSSPDYIGYQLLGGLYMYSSPDPAIQDWLVGWLVCPEQRGSELCSNSQAVFLSRDTYKHTAELRIRRITLHYRTCPAVLRIQN